MKTSNRILLILLISGIILFAAIHISLYRKYEKGEIVAERELLNKFYSNYALSVPAYLSISNFRNIVIIPSDSFHFEIEKKSGGTAGYKLIKDSLFIFGDTRPTVPLTAAAKPVVTTTGEKRIVALNTPSVFLSEQLLILYCPPLKILKIRNGSICLYGKTDHSKTRFEAYIQDCEFNFSNRNLYETAYENKYYDSISIHSVRSYVSLNKNSVVRSLYVSMDGESQLVDNKSIIENIYLDCKPDSWLHLSGENLKRVRQIIL